MIERLGQRTELDNKSRHLADHNALHYAFDAHIRQTKPTTPDNNVIAFRASLEAMRSGIYGGTLEIAPGDYVINDTLDLRNITGPRIIGAGGATRLIWRGAADKPILRLAHTRQADLANFEIVAETPAYAGIQVMRDNKGSPSVTPTMNSFRNIAIHGGGKLTEGIVLGGTGSVDANNDFNYFECVEVNNYTHAGYLMGDLQSYNNKFVNCRADGGTTGQYGVGTGSQVAGTFHWNGGFIGNNSKADFYIGRSYQPFLIENTNFEGSARWLEAPDVAHRQIEMSHCRWSAGGLHTDGRCVVAALGNRGSILLRQNSIGDGGGATHALTFDFTATDAQYALTTMALEYNDIYSTEPSLWAHRTPHILTRNTQVTNELTQATIMITS